MDKETIISRMKDGWDLANRGTGWWLSAPRIAYRATEKCQIEDSFVDELCNAGILKTELPYTTMFARLVADQPTSQEH